MNELGLLVCMWVDVGVYLFVRMRVCCARACRHRALIIALSPIYSVYMHDSKRCLHD